MSTERRLSETVARCAELAAIHRDVARDEGDESMRGGVRSAVAWMAELGLAPATVSEIVSDRVQDTLAARYGTEGAQSLAAELAAALDDTRLPAGSVGR